jgi:hypothetical protein
MSTRGIVLLGFTMFAATAAADTSGGPTADTAFISCAVDNDCVAVPQGGCCDNGYLVAVNSCSVDDYYFSTMCTDASQICSNLYVNDTRVAYCDFSQHACTMIEPTQIHCNGFINPNHQCPTGYQCQFHGVPDVGGTCVPAASTN